MTIAFKYIYCAFDNTSKGVRKVGILIKVPIPVCHYAPKMQHISMLPQKNFNILLKCFISPQHVVGVGKSNDFTMRKAHAIQAALQCKCAFNLPDEFNTYAFLSPFFNDGKNIIV